MGMTTMERLFLEIFCRKSRIERQLHQQLESYSQSLSCDIVAQGGRPPPWLWETGRGTAFCLDPGGLNKEQLVSGIFFPNSLANTSLEDHCTYFIIPDTKYGSICKPSNLLCEMSALDKSLNMELINKEATKSSEHNHSNMLESKAVDVCSEIDELDLVPTSISSQRDLESHVCKKVKTSKLEVQRRTSNQKIGRLTRSRAASKKTGCIKNSTAANKHADFQTVDGGRVTRSRSRLKTEDFNLSGKSLGANSFYQVKDVPLQPTECQSDVQPLPLAELNNPRSDAIKNVSIDHMYASDVAANNSITGKMQFATSSTLCDANFLVESKKLSLNGIHGCQVNENSFCEIFKENQLHSCENAPSRPEAVKSIQENSSSRQTMDMLVFPNQQVQQEDMVHNAEDISGLERDDRQLNGGIKEDREEFLSECAPHCVSRCKLPDIPAISHALSPACGSSFNSCETFHGNQVCSAVITSESSSGISVKHSGEEQLSRQLKSASKGDPALRQDEGKCMASGTCLQIGNPKDIDRRKKSVSGLEKRSKCTCSRDVSRNIDALQSRVEGSLCGACVSLVDIQLLKRDIVTTMPNLTGNDAHTAPTECQGERKEICKVADAAYNIEPASNGYKPSNTPVVSSSRLESETHKHTLSSQISDSSTFNSPSKYMEIGSAKTPDPARMDIILRSDECSAEITEDDIAGSCRVNLSVLPLSQKDSASPSAHRIIVESNFLEVEDPAVQKITSSENNNNRYFLRSSTFVNNATPVKSNASVLSCSGGDSKLLEAVKVEIGPHNVEKSMTKKFLASGYGESHDMASEGCYFLRHSTIHNRYISPHKSDGAYCVNESKKVEVTDHENEYSWPNKRNTKHKSSNILGTSPRSRARSFLEIKQHNICELKIGNKSETGMRLQSASKLISIQTPTAVPSESQQNNKSLEVLESQQNNKSHLLEHGSDLNLKKSFLIISPTVVRQNKTHRVEENSSVCSRDEVMTTNHMTFESEVHHSSGGAENAQSFMNAFQKEVSKDFGHHDGSDEGEEPFDSPKNMYECDMAGVSNIDGDKANYNESMPEFERFTMDFPYRLEDKTVYEVFDITSHAKEQALLDRSFFLEQLGLPNIILTPRSEPSMMNAVDDISDGFHLSPLGILENIDLGFSLAQDMVNVENLGASSSHKLMDICCNFGPQSGGPAPERSHSQSSLSTRLGSEYWNPPLTPPVLKKSYDRLSGKRNCSSFKMGSESELVCFRIDENSSTTEENADLIQVDHATHLASPRKIEASTSSKALSDVTAVYQNGTCLISNDREFVLRDSLQSVNSEVGFTPGFGHAGNGNSELEIKENPRNLVMKTRPQIASKSLSNMSEKSKVSCKSHERSGNYKNTTEGCKPSNILSNVSSFVPHVRQKQQGAPPLYGKKDVKVKALEVAEAAKRLEEKKQVARERRKAAAKLEREKLEHETAKQLELKQKLKEEERRRKEVDVAARKRHREEEERKAKERKRQCIEETRTLQREREEKLRQEKGKDFQEKAVKQKGRKQATNVKGQQKLEKEDNSNRNQIAPRVQHCAIQSASCTTESAHCIIQVIEASNENTSIAKGASSSDAISEVIEDISPTRKCQDSQSYEMSPYQISDDEDFEDDSWREKKYIPLWARSESLGSIILSVQHLDPKQIFCRKRSFNIPEVLSTRALRRPLR